jgi:hypothetical protein
MNKDLKDIQEKVNNHFVQNMKQEIRYQKQEKLHGRDVD